MSFTIRFAIADFSYEDLDDYSPVVSDYEDTNDGTGEGHSSTNKAEKVENFNLIDQILGQSSNRDDDDEPLDYNVMELAETEDTNPDPNTGMLFKGDGSDFCNELPSNITIFCFASCRRRNERERANGCGHD